MQLEGTVQNGVVVLDHQGVFPEGARVAVVLHDDSVGKAKLRDRLLRLAGTVDDLPVDMAKNHDHYIHGAPKK